MEVSVIRGGLMDENYFIEFFEPSFSHAFGRVGCGVS